MPKYRSICVVIPAYNEERLIATTLASIPGFIKAIAVVDDCSTDRTRAVVDSFEDERVHLLVHEDNRGVGAAIVSGYRWAMNAGFELVVVMGGDGQMHPDDLPALLAPLVRGEADYVKGNRLAHPATPRVMPKWRYFGNRILSRFTRYTSGYQDIDDSQCGYTVVTTDILRKIDLTNIYRRYGFPNDLLAHLHSVGARIRNVEVRPVYENEETGITPLGAVFSLSWVLLRSWTMRLNRERHN